MRAHAAVLVLALLLSPMASAVCELRCSRPTASPPVDAQASCHDGGSDARQTLHSEPRHCGDRHSDDVTVGAERSVAFSSRDLHAVYFVAVAHPQRSSTILFLGRPPGLRSVVRSAASPPPLRI